MTSKTELEDAVAEATEEMVNTYSNAPKFSWTLVPSKPLRDGGMGMNWNGWYAALLDFKTLLPDKRPYSRLVIDPMLADRTFGKNLSSLRYWLVEQLLLIEARNV